VITSNGITTLYNIYNCTYAALNRYYVNFCTTCPYGCQFCASDTECVSCIANYTLTNKYCCTGGQTANVTVSPQNVTVKTCMYCPLNCISCLNSAICLECDTNYTLDSSRRCSIIVIVPNATNPTTTNNSNTGNTSNAGNKTNASNATSNSNIANATNGPNHSSTSNSSISSRNTTSNNT